MFTLYFCFKIAIFSRKASFRSLHIIVNCLLFPFSIFFSFPQTMHNSNYRLLLLLFLLYELVSLTCFKCNFNFHFPQTISITTWTCFTFLSSLIEELNRKRKFLLRITRNKMQFAFDEDWTWTSSRKMLRYFHLTSSIPFRNTLIVKMYFFHFFSSGWKSPRGETVKIVR